MIFRNTIELQDYLKCGRYKIYRLLEQGVITRLDDGRVMIDDAAVIALKGGKLTREEILQATSGMRRRELELWLALYEQETNHRLHPATIYRWRKEKKSNRRLSQWQSEALRLYLSPNQPPVSAVARAVQERFTGVSYWKIYRFLRDYERRNYDVVTLARVGERALKAKVLKYIERTPELLRPNDLWSADGHTLNVFVSDGARKFRPVLLCFHDFATGRICGWEIWRSENSEAIAGALFWGIVETQTIPRVIYIDNGRAFQSRTIKNVCDQLGIEIITALPYNARSKKVERFFGTLDLQFSKSLEAYTGKNPIHKPADYHRSEKFLRALNGGDRRAIPIDSFYTLLKEYIEEYNSKVPTAATSARRLDNPYPILSLLPLRRARLYRNGFRFRNKFYWAEELYGLKTGEVYTIRWSLHFPDRIFVDLGDGEYITAYETQRHHPAAFVLGTEEDQKKLRQELALQRALQKRTQDKLRNILGEKTVKKAVKKLPETNKNPENEDGIILWASDLLNNQGAKND